MILADIKGKLSLKEWYSEDFLTSTVFSTFKYLDEKWINKYLNQAINTKGDNLCIELKNPQYDFWSYFSSIKETGCGIEPDVVIYSEDRAVIIEAKNYSGKSGTGIIEEEIKDDELIIDSKKLADQLGKQYFVGRRSIKGFIKAIDESIFDIDSFVLVFLTRHPSFPKYEIEETMNAIAKINPKERETAEQNIYWLNWQKAVPIFDEIIDTKSKDTFEYKISKDVVVFLDRRNLGVFSGFDFLDDYQFFRDEYKSAFKKKNLFYKKVFKPYWIFLDRGNESLTIGKHPIFYITKVLPYWEYLKDSIKVSGNFVFYEITYTPYWEYIQDGIQASDNFVFYEITYTPYWEKIPLNFEFSLHDEIFYKE